MAKPLSGQEVRFYEENGYLIPRLRLEPEALAELQRQAGRLVRDNPQRKDQIIVAPHIRSTLETGLVSDGAIVRFATEPLLLDMIEQLIGPDLVLWTTSLFHKQALCGPATPWHQDARYWPMSPLETASYWIAVTESRRENACMRVIPGSHRTRTFARHVKTEGRAEFGLTLAPDAFDEKLSVDIELEPGQMLVFDAFLIHGSHPNNGVKVRTGFSARFMPSHCHFNHDFEYAGKVGYADRALMLVRGIDRGRNDFARNHPGSRAAIR